MVVTRFNGYRTALWMHCIPTGVVRLICWMVPAGPERVLRRSNWWCFVCMTVLR